MISRIILILLLCLNSALSTVAQHKEVDVLIQIMDSSENITEDLELYYTNKYQEDYKNIDSIFIVNSKPLLEKGKAYYYKHELTRATLLHDYYLNTLQAIRVFSNLHNDSELKKYPQIYERFLHFAGRLCLHLDRIEESIDFFQKSIAINEIAKDSAKIKGALINIGIAYSAIENFDSTLHYYNKAQVLQDNGIKKYSDNLAFNFAAVYQEKGDYQSTIETYKNLVEEHQNESRAPDAALHYNLAVAYFEIDEFELGLPLIDLAEDIAASENDIYVLRNIYDTKTMVYESLSNFELTVKYIQLKDSIEELLPVESGSHLLDNLKNRNELAKSLAESNVVKTELGFLRREKNLIITLGVILLLATISYILILHRKNTRKLALVKSNLAQVLEKENRSNGSSPAEKRRETTRNLDEIIDKIESELKVKELFKNPNVSIALLAKRINSNTTEVSNVVNDCFEMPFRDLINKLRIEEARKMLTDPKFDHYSIEGISQLVGYKSISSFNINFKKHTGITPSFYRKKSNQLR